jgi:hypothetical protein
MMLRKRARGLSYGASMVGIAVLALYVWSPGDPINGKNLMKLKQGMSPAQVEGVFGCPEETNDRAKDGASRWVGHEWTLYAWFDDHSRLTWAHLEWQTSHNTSLNWFTAWRKRLGW